MDVVFWTVVIYDLRLATIFVFFFFLSFLLPESCIASMIWPLPDGSLHNDICGKWKYMYLQLARYRD
ncbi:hypothetical protein SAMN04487894_101626 [Niabella drilacis]|uniref:Uncharacterized protein n=1 Tax=Niabella drilacis (strain DSM 25811 / CCM 8410 / CCUG 62505 / LMG 26954 / E90) TaxID=1285928 RepID=A0A1G6JSH3_NIADE|nr:hypothetical protein SAMN04487894_101626 [Niabella drilacis]